MKPFQIYITYVSWGSGGKRRPVLVFSLTEETAFVYAVTSQYETKSKTMQAKYFKINNWSHAGLVRLSYVDTSSYFRIPLSFLGEKAPIGELSANDKLRLLEFLTQKQC